MRIRGLLIVLLIGLMPSLGWADGKTVQVLTVGNSFANNALTYLADIASADGNTLVSMRANLGGCTMERHWKHVAKFEANPKDKAGSPYYRNTKSLKDLLTAKDWDYVTIQQVSWKSHDLSTYSPYYRDLYDYIREYAPGADILAHQIWAYRVDDPRFSESNTSPDGPHTQQEMFEMVRHAYHTIAKDLGIGILPSGDAMYLADTDPTWGYKPDATFDFAAAVEPNLPDQTHSLHGGWFWRKQDDKMNLRMDGHHANTNGKYLIGCVWYEVLFGESVVGNAFVPEQIDPDYARFLQETAHKAVYQLRLEVAKEMLEAAQAPAETSAN